MLHYPNQPHHRTKEIPIVGIQITITDTDNLSEQDRAVLAVLAGVAAKTPTAEATPAPAPAARVVRAVKKAAAKPEPEDDEPEDTATEEEEPAEPVSSKPTLKDAVARATELVGLHQQDRVRAALTDLGVKKVGELDSDDIAAFLTALED